jgi:hypothetical protein
LSIDSFGRAFQHGAEGAKFGFKIGVISTILIVVGISAHGTITEAQRVADAFARISTSAFESKSRNRYLSADLRSSKF